MVGVISAVSQESSERPDPIEQACRDRDVVDIAGGQDERARPAFAVGECVELAGAAASRLAERLLEGPPFPPLAERCALMWVLSIAASPYMPLWPVSASKILNQSPCRLQRLKRL
jgi:hypothetical protein